VRSKFFTGRFYHDCPFALLVLHSPGPVTIRSEEPACPHHRNATSKGVRTRLRNLSKNFYRAVESGDEEEARRIRDESQREYDKAAGKGMIHPNRAARKVSRLDKTLAANRSE
jgi:small subunit ribosomal protein S20